MNYTAGSNETLYWHDQPSQLVYAKQYVLYGLGLLICLGSLGAYPFLAIPAMFFLGFKIFEKYWEIKQSDFFLSHERLRIVKGGLFGRRTFDVEIFRLRDVELHEPFWHQIFGLGILEIRNLQWDKEKVMLNGVRDPQAVREIIRGVATNSRNVSTYMSLDLSQLQRAEQQKRLR